MTDQLREDIAKIDALSRLLFEQQFIRCGGRKDGDPTWDELEQAERDDYLDRALDAEPLLAAKDQRFADLQEEHRKSGESWDSHRELLRRQIDLLLWLHAEAVHKLSLPCGSCHPCMHWDAEVLRRERDETEASRRDWAAEALRLEFRLEQVREDRQRRIEKGNRLRSALVAAFGYDEDPDEYPGDDVLIEALGSRPVCAVHPEEGR